MWNRGIQMAATVSIGGWARVSPELGNKCSIALCQAWQWFFPDLHPLFSGHRTKEAHTRLTDLGEGIGHRQNLLLSTPYPGPDPPPNPSYLCPVPPFPPRQLSLTIEHLVLALQQCVFLVLRPSINQH